MSETPASDEKTPVKTKAARPPAAVKAEGETPTKPAAKPAAKKGKADADERRGFLATAWLAFTAASTAGTLALVRFMFPNVLAERPSQFNVGPASQFEPGSVDERWKVDFQVWIVHLTEERKIVALSTVCTHLGCSPSWLEQEQKFKCPCHGSGFYKNGVNFEGPAPRPLERFAISEVDGVILVDKSRKFQAELQQWGDSSSYITT